jgi:hypothetical protein
MNLIKSEIPVCPDVLISPVLGDDGRAPGSLRILDVALSSLNIRRLFLAFDSFIRSSPYITISWW